MFRKVKIARPALAAALLSSAAFAQFNNQWVTFVQDDTHIRDSNGNVANSILTDTQEKDYSYGDLDQDGWVDLIVMRKQPFTTTGAQQPQLLMNEGGLLVDRSAQYASASDVGGDAGFMTATNNRDSVVVDVNMDGWLDVVTATTLSDGQPKHISHPRVYVNQGDDFLGNWLGLRFENFRIPTISPTPRFCGIDAGDVTGDGAPDLYFADYGSTWDRLLINDGNGIFSDSMFTRLTPAMCDAAFGTSADIVDMNGDGLKDIVRASGVTGSGSGPLVSVAYNDPANIGFFPQSKYQANVASSASYHADVGDLNNDNRMDFIASDDGSDNYRYNTGNNSNGQVLWGPNKFYQFVGGSDGGFAGTCLVVDMDNDGWKDTLHADVDVDIPGCGGRLHIYHNPGGVVGGSITLIEEAQQSGSGGWKGAVGLLASDLQGTYDIAVFDIDNDGDQDLIIGRCSGTDVWINQAQSCPTMAYKYGAQSMNSTGLPGSIEMNGTASISANDMVLDATNLPPNATSVYLFGTTRLWNPVPFGNGLRFIGGPLLRLPAQVATPAGTLSFAADFNVGSLSTLVPGDVRNFMLWFRDPAAGGQLFNGSDALEIRFCN